MEMRDTHIIQQQYFEIQFEDFSDGIGVQNEIKDLFYEKLLPGIEELFDEISQGKYTVSLEKLEIDCGLLNRKYWKEELAEETLRHIRQELIVQHKKEINEADPESANSFHDFIFFLKKGYLPWNGRIDSIRQLEDEIADKFHLSKMYADRLKELLTSEPATIERLLYSFTDGFFKNILEQLAEDKKESLDRMELYLDKEKMTGRQKHLAHSLLLKVLSDDHRDPEQQFYSSLPDILDKDKNGNQPNHPGTRKKESESIYIQNAGLIILHPFLAELFTRVGLLAEKHWKDIFSQHTAVQVLEFLGSGKEDFPEFILSLNKILCGLDISEALEPVETLCPSIKSECGDLLEEVIRHWSILKNTSVETLRETFLQRNGKLTRVDKGWLLHVEQKGVDVLLNSLPWGIGTIKLPWTEEKLHVEWI
jgi:hypothetical protein